jgi:putative inorganic carbon (HCO3(-)) transporter
MLHQILFILAFLCLLPAIAASPFVGTIVYKWLEYLPPETAYSVNLLPDRLSYFVAAMTFLFWFLRERKDLPRPPLLILLLIMYFLWINVTTYFALVPAGALWQWNRTVKIIGFAVLTALMLRNRWRIEAAVWILVLCVGYSAIPGAIKTVVSGGGAFTVVGVTGSDIEDRVAFSVVLPIIAPLALFLSRYATLLPPSRWLKRALQGVAASCFIALIGTFARTALFSGGAALVMLTAKSKRKVFAAVAACAVLLLCLMIAPASWFNRMDTTTNYHEDASAESRIASWKWSWKMTLEHPVLGGGFRVEELNRQPNGGWLESHNIVFEVMVEHGFVGLALFCGLIGAAYHSCTVVARQTRQRRDLDWATDLARMLQAGLIAFLAGGMFISVASYPFLYDLVALTIGLRSVVERETAKSRVRSPVPGREVAGMLPAQ